MHTKMMLKEAFKAAADQHTWDGHSTRDGETAKTLDEWADKVQAPDWPSAVLFTCDRARIGDRAQILRTSNG